MKNKGIVAINKPANWTSFDVVNKIKHILYPQKVGHLGTLDPMATGVLLVTIGKATKLFDLMQEKTKTYVAEFEFGYETDTLDSTGKVINKKENEYIDKLNLIKAIQTQIGEIEQIPPKYSAKSINGKRAYDLARKDVEFELKSKKVSVYQIDLISFDGIKCKLKIQCGSGTYIRAIGRDIAKELNTFATMTSLVRTNVDKFSLESCQNIQDLTVENIKIYDINEVLNYPIMHLEKLELTKILNGQVIETEKNDGNYVLNDGDNTLAIVKVDKNFAKMSIFLG
ncbi:MAG: tRNA pseudouridine(55) synthase TruB [Candidatus Onthoplasma sp.]